MAKQYKWLVRARQTSRSFEFAMRNNLLDTYPYVYASGIEKTRKAAKEKALQAKSNYNQIIVIIPMD